MGGPIISDGWVGRIIDGRFALHAWLGGTGRSALFRTELQQPIGKKAAIKLIVAEGAEADAYLASWAKIGNLSHPHLMRVFRSGRFQFGSISMVYVVTECADEVLAQIVPERALTSEETREMLEPVVDALEYLHGKGFVHGHLKPSNILVVDEQLKISGDNLTPAGEVRNRFQMPSAYDAPETANGPISPAADVWALGMTLVEVLTQRPLQWDRTSTREPVVPEMPRLFAEIARECLRSDPTQRCTLSAIKARLASNVPIAFPAVGRASETAPVPDAVPEAVEQSRAASRKKRKLVLAACAVVLVAVFAWSMLRRPPQENGTASGGESSAVPTETRTPKAAQEGPAPVGMTAKGGVAERTMPVVASFARATIHGTVSVAVRVHVDANGQVTDAALTSAGPSKYFARVALEAARGWKFKPAAVASAWTLHFKFRRDGDEASAVEETR